ncbi:OTU-domain-containing protein [Xylariaceae sp. FL0016]|nr:OTU-domain-containing protein [Xylariaceae sp. FL0016]
MKLRYKAREGGGTLEIDDSANVRALFDALKQKTGYSDFTVKYGWPLRALGREQDEESVRTLGLQRESLTVVPAESVVPPAEATPSASAGPGAAPTRPESPRGVRDQNISVQMPETGSSLVLRVMPDDNSCLFTAVAGAVRGLPTEKDAYTPDRLRHIAVEQIQADPIKYNQVVLDSPPLAYCERMLQSDTWGGAIELGIFSEFFQLEICSVDVKTGNVIRYGEGLYENRCIVVYSNVHYDRIAETFFEGQEDMDFDVTRWSVYTSDHFIEHAKKMCRELKEKHHYYTDTSDFVVTCNQCGWVGQGEKAVAQHSLATGHSQITEIQDTGA